jgi:hypothetical protein
LWKKGEENVVRRWSIAVVAALPGLALAVSAKPFLLGDAALLLGIGLAFGLPLAWLSIPPRTAPRGKEQERPP